MSRLCVRWSSLAFGSFAVLTLWSGALLGQATPPSADTFVSSAFPRTNYGSSIILVVQSGANAYLQFNLSTLPAGVTVNKATLRLYIDAVGKSGSFDVYQLNSSWNENTLTYSTPPPGLGASATGGNPIPISGASLNQFLLIDITPVVQGWVNGAIANNGVALALSGSSGSFSFDSKESLLTGNGPELEIVLNGPPGPQGPQGLQGVQGPPGPPLPDLVYTDQNNTLTSNQVLQGNILLAPVGTATPVQGFNSFPLDLQASAFDGVKAQSQTFRWQAEPTGNNSSNASGKLNLLFGGGNGIHPTETGFSLTPNGGLSLNSISSSAALSITPGTDLLVTVLHDISLLSHHDLTMTTDNDNVQTTHGNLVTTVDKDATETVHGNLTTTTDKNQTEAIHGALTVTADQGVALTSGTGLEFVVGGTGSLTTGSDLIFTSTGNTVLQANQAATVAVGTNAALTVGAGLTATVGKTASLTAGADLSLNSGQDMGLLTQNNFVLTAAEASTLSTGTDFSLTTGANLTMQAGKDVSLTAGSDFGLTSSGNFNLNSGVGFNLTSSDVKLKSSGAMTLEAGGVVSINAPAVNVSGILSKGGGSFKIDHPLDPLNKYLYHSFVESPDMMNVYNGNIVTDRRGLATVVLPDYFEALNRDFRYQLTVIGQFSQAIVARKIANNRFVIKTNRPRVEVSWQVTGIRQDAFANLHRIPVEEEKPKEARGTYLHPEAFVTEKKGATVAALKTHESH